jgi:hypothetical protein
MIRFDDSEIELIEGTRVKITGINEYSGTCRGYLINGDVQTVLQYRILETLLKISEKIGDSE